MVQLSEFCLDNGQYILLTWLVVDNSQTNYYKLTYKHWGSMHNNSTQMAVLH